MSDPFRQPRDRNAFDRLEVDVAALYERFPIDRAVSWPVAPPTRSNALYSARWLPLEIRRKAWRLLRRLRIDERWFDEFAAYWTSVLGGRPLWSAEDFHFLRGVYRIRHQDNQVPDTGDLRLHVDAWQQPELLYQLFQQVMMESLGPKLQVCRALAAHATRPLGSLLEYGCATAPVVTTFLEFFGSTASTAFFIADIQTVSFHYAAFRFRRNARVVPRLLRPEQRFVLSLDAPVDAVCCMAVLEHLPDPRRAIEDLAAALRPGGVLVFDYFLGGGEGLDTRRSVDERGVVLDFIGGHFDMLEGTLTIDRSIGFAVARKR